MCGIFTITNYSQGFWVGPVTAEFGWSAPQFFLSYTVLMCLGLITGPVVGSIAQRKGLRTVGLIGLAGHSVAYFMLSFNNGSLMMWYLNWAVIAILGAGSLPIVWTGVLNKWFQKHRGKAIGITMAGTGLGAFLLPSFVEFLTANYGWRAAYRGIGVAALVDRFWAPGVAACFFVLPTLGLLMLVNLEVTFATGILVAILIGLAAGAELDLLAFLTSKYFGPAHYPAIFGAIIAFFTVGAGIAPPLFGATAKAFSGYATILSISVGLLVLSIVLFLSLGKYPPEETDTTAGESS